MARQYLMRLLFVGQAIPLSDINMWCNATSRFAIVNVIRTWQLCRWFFSINSSQFISQNLFRENSNL